MRGGSKRKVARPARPIMSEKHKKGNLRNEKRKGENPIHTTRVERMKKQSQEWIGDTIRNSTKLPTLYAVNSLNKKHSRPWIPLKSSIKHGMEKSRQSRGGKP